jgi:poly-gamma-glutamate synthesis protein (capsule biosynthesis protein)
MRPGPLLSIVLALLAGGAKAQPLCRPEPTAIPVVNACARGPRVSVAVVGDVLLHEVLQRVGYRYGFAVLWQAAVPILSAADVAIANLEVPTAPGFARGGRRRADPGAVFDGVVHTDYPQFNAHPSVIDALAAAGVDAVTVANNHALDRGPAGLDATLGELAARRMPATGAIVGGAPRDFAVRLPTRLGVLALIGCTYGTNGIPDPRRQVLNCFQDRAELLALVRAESARPGAAGVIVLPHWGDEYSHSPNAAQRALAAELAQAGALAVVGTHPHVVQPWEYPQGPRGRVPVVHSTGNFVAAQIELSRRVGILAWLDLCPTAQGVAVGAAGHLPMVMDFDRWPQVTIPDAEAAGSGAAARALLDRLLPGTDLTAALTCGAPRRTPAPPPEAFER